MDLSFDLLGNALVSGLLLGGFYASATIGVSISFGMLDIVNIAHPAFILLGSYVAYTMNSNFGFDPILVSIVAMPLFYFLGVAIYHVYDVSFERRGDTALRGLAFFFGLLFITEVALVLIFGVDYRLVDAVYIQTDAAFRRHRRAVAAAGAGAGFACDDGRLATLSVTHLHRPRGSGGGAGPDGAAVDGGGSEPDQAHRIRPVDRHAPRSPARS